MKNTINSKEEYDASYWQNKKEYNGKVTLSNVNKNLTEDEKIDSVEKQINSLAKEYSQNEVENLIIKRKK